MTVPPHYPVEAFFADPVRTAPALAPDGTRLSYLAPRDGRLNVWVEPVDGGEAVCVTHDVRRGIRSYRWAVDPRWLLYLQDEGGDENWHLFRVDLEHPKQPAEDLTPYPGVTVEYELLPAEPTTALVTMNLRDRSLRDVYRLDLATGSYELLVQNPGDVAGWVFSASGRVFARSVDAAGNHVLNRWDQERGLVPLATFSGAAHPVTLSPLEATADGSALLVGSNESGEQTELVRVDASDGSVTVLASDEALSLDVTAAGMPGSVPPALIKRRADGRLLAARFLGERQQIRVLDPAFTPVLQSLSALSDGDLGFVSSDVSGRRWVATFLHDTDPDAAFLYDHETGESRLLYRPYPQLDPAHLAPVRPVDIAARDGLRLPCYLTLPVGREPVGLPMVLLVHGGPWSRDRWGFNPRVQLLANRGYAVLQVNMRGSTGYGRSFLRAAVREFAGKMHDDLVDGVAWAVEQGIADPSRVAIFGGSYGGYSALVGATFTPDVFAAAVDYCGVSNLANFLRNVPPYWHNILASSWHHYVGDPAVPEDEADMLARSPITRLDALRCPLLVIQGARDTRVVQAESDNIVRALRERGADVEYLLKEDEGHGFVNAENSIEMFTVIERFLHRTIGDGRCPSNEGQNGQRVRTNRA
jgi:dipeptidyl aminopeptidase/acylaminoacyl peptidase